MCNTYNLRHRNEAILARQSGEKLDYFVPDETILIQNPGAVTKTASQAAEEFLKFLTGKEAQTEYEQAGFRPLVDGITDPVDGANDPAHPFPQPKKLMTIDDFGGWDQADPKFFDEKAGLVTKIQQQTGKQ